MKDNFLSINGNLTDLVESLEYLNKQQMNNSITKNKTAPFKSDLIKNGLKRRNSTKNSMKNLTIFQPSQINMTSKLEKAIVSLNNVNDTITKKIKSFEKFFYTDLRRIKNLNQNKKKKYDNGMLFYNSLSLVMLSMLAGGLVGVVFILYFTFKKDDNSSF
jgi:hypothetical protein